jgi:hypothetical protein
MFHGVVQHKTHICLIALLLMVITILFNLFTRPTVSRAIHLPFYHLRLRRQFPFIFFILDKSTVFSCGWCYQAISHPLASCI